MRAQILVVVLGSVLALAGAGCGGNASKGSGKGPTTLQPVGNQDEFIAQLCDEYMPCCEAAGRPSTGAQCRAFYAAFAPTSGYDRAQAEACLDEIRAADDQCDMSSASSPSCSRVFVSSGTKRAGEACDQDSDCVTPEAGQVTCRDGYAAGASVRQCQVRLQGKVGSTPCLGTSEGNVTYFDGNNEGLPLSGYICDVGEGLACDNTTGACQRLPTSGEACLTGQFQCEATTYCSFPESMCQRRSALGAICVSSNECNLGAYCDLTSSTCKASRAVGEACASSDECSSHDCTNQKCGPDSDLALVFLCGTN